ncbi:hypothetical protein QE429_000747 [Bacillus sp. SORGH_AS 510]|uniref:hypothetical protein n=1 Tax=Bacillus sp. SORGH_AS_0510 TaxID=3041771 RepID=UPI0027885D75|nr:hypothetical protein [Bacillus sp. SORGH_AS_0510]MDQ1143920.1 hypothetical protein [Bacillus sp. SORGH_AS_0510]
MNKTILIELDEQYLAGQISEVAKWFNHVLTIQTALEHVVANAIPTIMEPHIREAIEKMKRANKHHTECAKELFRVIDKSPNTVSDQLTGQTVANMETALFSLQDVMGGAAGSWKQLHSLLHINQQAMGAFAVAEQLGLSLGMKEIVALAFPIVHEKTMHQLLLQEYMLEMAPISILYKQNT